MNCMIDKKDYSDMNEKCLAGIEHLQLVCTLHCITLKTIYCGLSK